MFGIGGNEILIILLFAFLIFGPDKLPKAARTIGRAIRQFKNAQDEMNRVIKTEVYDPLTEGGSGKSAFGFSSGAKKESNTVEQAAKEETFAERKARMTREKEAAKKAREQGVTAKAKPAPKAEASPTDTEKASASPPSGKSNPVEASTDSSSSGAKPVPGSFAERRAAAIAAAKEAKREKV